MRGLKNIIFIKAVCDKFYGEANRDKCMMKQHFCAMCCNHFIGVKYLEEQRLCERKCFAAIRSHTKNGPSYPPVPLRPRNTCAIIFEKVGYKGRAIMICNKSGGIVKITNPIPWKLEINSVKVGIGTKVYLYAEPNYKGLHFEATKDVPDLKKAGFRQHSSSAKIEANPAQGCITVFEKFHLEGKTKLICKSGDLGKLGWSDNFVRSIKIGPNTNLMGYQGLHYAKKHFFTANNLMKVTDKDVPNILSAKIFPFKKIGCAMLFDEINYGGHSKLACMGNRPTSSIGFNKKIASIRVPEFTFVLLYIKKDYVGHHIQIDKDIPNLTNEFHQKNLSSKIWAKPKEGCAIFFSKKNYNGEAKSFCKGQHDHLPSIGWKYPVRSILLGHFTLVDLYQKLHYKGEHIKDLKVSTPDLAKRGYIVNKTQSTVVKFFRVVTPHKFCVVIFDDKNYEGNFKQICGTKNYPKLGTISWKNKISSIKIGKFAYVLVYTGEGYRGNHLIIKKDKNILPSQFNNKIISIKVIKNFKLHGPIAGWRGHKIDSATGEITGGMFDIPQEKCVIVYRKEKYHGIFKQMCKSYNNLRQIHWNDKINSIKIGRKVNAILFKDINFKGKKLKLIRHQLELKSKDFNNKVSSIRIVPVEPHGPYSTWRNRTWDSASGKFKAGKTIPPERTPAGPGCVNLFEKINFKGLSKNNICGNRKDFVSLGWNFPVSSIQLGTKTHLFLYDKTNFKGKFLKLTASEANLVGKRWHNKIFSFRAFKAPPTITLPTGCVVLYSMKNYEGKYKKICGNNGNLHALKMDNIAESIRVGPTTDVKLFDKINFKGAHIFTKKSIKDLSKSNFLGKTTSIQAKHHITPPVPQNGCMVAFQNADYKGKFKKICNNRIANLGSWGFSNKISSITVGPHTRVFLWDLASYHGKKIMLTKNISNLGSLHFNDKTTSLKVQRIPPPSPPPHATRGCAVFFVNANYKGKWRKVCGNLINIKSIKFQRKLSSIQVGPHTLVTLWDHASYRGQSFKTLRSIPNLTPKGWNDKATSAKVFVYRPVPRMVRSGCIIIFKDINYKGPWKLLCKNYPNLVSIHWNDKLSSVKVGARTTAIFYGNENYQGTAKTLKGSYSDFRRLHLNDKISSVKVFKNPVNPRRGCAQIFQATYFHGMSKMVCGNISNLGRIHWSNVMSSIKIGPHTTALIYDGVNFKGKNKRLTGSKVNLTGTSLDNKTSSIKVFVTGTGVANWRHRKIVNRTGKFTPHGHGQVHHAGSTKWRGKKVYQAAGKYTPHGGHGHGHGGFTKWRGKKVYQAAGKYTPHGGHGGHGHGHGGFTSWRGKRVYQAAGKYTPHGGHGHGHRGLRSGCVIMYEHTNYRGKRRLVCGALRNFVPIHWNDILSSIKVGPWTYAILYWDVNYRGRKLVVHHSLNNLIRYHWNDKASSIKVFKRRRRRRGLRTGCVIMYADINYRGKHRLVCGALRNFVPIHWNDILSSIKIGSWTWAMLYWDVNYRGRKLRVNRSLPDLRRYHWNDKASSIRVFRKAHGGHQRWLHWGCIAMYQHINYKGRKRRVCGAIRNFVPIHWNDILSSIRVGPWTWAMLYWDVNYRGKKLRVNRSLNDLRRYHWNDKASSIKVFKKAHGHRGLRSGCAVMYADINYRGKHRLVCGAISNFVPIHWNDILSSIKVGAATYAMLYWDVNYKGKKLKVNRSLPDLRRYHWNDKVSSIKVFGGHGHYRFKRVLRWVRIRRGGRWIRIRRWVRLIYRNRRWIVWHRKITWRIIYRWKWVRRHGRRIRIRYKVRLFRKGRKWIRWRLVWKRIKVKLHGRWVWRRRRVRLIRRGRRWIRWKITWHFKRVTRRHGRLIRYRHVVWRIIYRWKWVRRHGRRVRIRYKVRLAKKGGKWLRWRLVWKRIKVKVHGRWVWKRRRIKLIKRGRRWIRWKVHWHFKRVTKRHGRLIRYRRIIHRRVIHRRIYRRRVRHKRLLQINHNKHLFHIITGNAGKCLHVHNASKVNGALVQQKQCNNSDNQKWKVSCLLNFRQLNILKGM